MTRWFLSLPLHRKLITIALAVSTAALSAAILGLLAFDTARFRTSAADDARAFAQVVAENTAAAIMFDDPEAARQTLASLRVREVVTLACIYREDGALLASYRRSPDGHCPPRPQTVRSWSMVASQVTVRRNGRPVGTVYVERSLSDLSGRVLATAAAGGLTLLLAAGLAFGLAQRLQRIVSRPIVALAHAARAIGNDERYAMPVIETAPDETGELVHAFNDMVDRLTSSNEALRREVEERTRMQAEREHLLVREREANRLKDEFLAAVSHELRTPLNAILGWTQILSTTKPDAATVDKAIASLARNAQAQNRVIEDLLDVSRIVTGKMQLTFGTVDLRSVIESAVEVIGPVADAKNIQLDFEIPAVPCTVRADYDRLRQVVWNLLSNAVKFTSASGRVHVRLYEDGKAYAISVSDTGIGIAPGFLDHVFERFRQADGSTTRQHGGLGLGLAIVKELTELHGGTVRADSAGPGRGATFTVTLPRAAQAAASPILSPRASLPPLPRLDGVDVLAVDDNPDALDIIRPALGGAGARVRVAASGMEALDQIRRARPDIVLCDIGMPQMDGFELLRRIRALDDPASRRVPVLAVSAYASEDYRIRSLRAGFQGHVAKPFNPFDLVQTVADVLTRV